jgi:hypothetical protein
MKTPEDEAFDELARKQGAWGGGFTAKRQAAMDKINAEFREEYIKYRTAFPKEYTAPQPAQEPDCQATGVCVRSGLYAAPQPAQEPVALVIDGVLVKSALPEKYTGHLYTAPPQRPWVDLSDSQIEQVYYDVAKLHRGAAMPWGQIQFGRVLQALIKEKNT